jgi:hypothetical protein
MEGGDARPKHRKHPAAPGMMDSAHMSQGQSYGWEVTAEHSSAKLHLGGEAPPYTPRRSARFDQQEVLAAIKSAPHLPSAALTPRYTDISQSVHYHDTSRLDSSRTYLPPPITPRSSAFGFTAQQNGNGVSPDHLERSSWLPSPRPSLGGSLKVPNYEPSLDGSFVSKQVLETQQPEFLSRLETSLMDHIRTGDTSLIDHHVRTGLDDAGKRASDSGRSDGALSPNVSTRPPGGGAPRRPAPPNAHRRAPPSG